MSEPLSEERLAAIRARCEAATPGEWRAYGLDYFHEDEPVQGICNEGTSLLIEVNCNDPGDMQAKADAQFIAHARTDVPDLLAEVERLRAALHAIAGLHLRGISSYENDAKDAQRIAREVLAPK